MANTMTDDQQLRSEEQQEQVNAVSRRAIAKKVAKVAYVAPVVLAVISAGERPALAQSITPEQ